VPPPTLAAVPARPGVVSEGQDRSTATKPFAPTVFIVGAALTAGSIGFLVWSGVNAENDPGTAAVVMKCAGQGPTCPTYEAGEAAQLRTNIALGVTAGLAVATGLVGIFFTQWSPSGPSTKRLLQPTGVVLPGGAALGLGGTF
jgi:hypothetical protein